MAEHGPTELVQSCYSTSVMRPKHSAHPQARCTEFNGQKGEWQPWLTDWGECIRIHVSYHSTNTLLMLISLTTTAFALDKGIEGDWGWMWRDGIVDRSTRWSLEEEAEKDQIFFLFYFILISICIESYSVYFQWMFIFLFFSLFLTQNCQIQ